MKEVQEAFDKTNEILFGKPIGNIQNYEAWLTNRTLAGKLGKSAITNKPIYLPKYSIFKTVPENCAAEVEALPDLSKKSVPIDENETMENLAKKLPGILPFIVEFEEGENSNIQDSTIYFNLHYAYKAIDCFRSKYVAYSFWLDECDHVFGNFRSFYCSFSINCFKSIKVTRSFEVDSSKNCSDVMFCHNCDNVRDSIFCFNAKNKRYAIANVEVGKDAFMKAKAVLVKYILDELEKKRYLEINVHNIGAKKK
ncbi:hypothetical protein HZC07_01225 [Candidatus Micrarchaeota archaeon]|nr:hypothetical protein [Candidatus Micrarchaeota archaeon]